MFKLAIIFVAVTLLSATPEEPPATNVTYQQGQEKTTYVGTFKVTAYCACEICCGESPDGITKNGATATEGITVGADTSTLPMNTEIYIEGIGHRVVQDTGSGIHGNELDLYFDSHEAALNFGVQYLDVYVQNN